MANETVLVLLTTHTAGCKPGDVKRFPRAEGQSIIDAGLGQPAGADAAKAEKAAAKEAEEAEAAAEKARKEAELEEAKNSGS